MVRQTLADAVLTAFDAGDSGAHHCLPLLVSAACDGAGFIALMYSVI